MWARQSEASGGLEADLEDLDRPIGSAHVGEPRDQAALDLQPSVRVRLAVRQHR